MLLAASPLFGSVSVLGMALGACLILLLMVRSARQAPQPDAVEDLTFRCQHPFQHAMAHPFKAIRRRMVR